MNLGAWPLTAGCALAAVEDAGLGQISSRSWWSGVFVRARKSVVIAVLIMWGGKAVAQQADKDPAAVVEIGAAGAQSLKGEGSSFGPTIAVEVTPVENWLELEGGVTPLFSRGATEWSTDLLFKKPWTLSDKVEFMAGVGPEWVHTTSHGQTTNSVAGEAALDFMFWPSAEHTVGWYLEPSYDYGFGRGHEQSLGVNVGLIIAIP